MHTRTYIYIYIGKLISTDPLALPASRFLMPISSSNSAQIVTLQYDSCKFKKYFATSQADILKDETLNTCRVFIYTAVHKLNLSLIHI